MGGGSRLLGSPDGRITDLRGDRFECQVETRQMNLERLDAEIFEGRHLVTASALLDLVSESWLRLLAAVAAQFGRRCSSRSPTTVDRRAIRLNPKMTWFGT